MIDLLNRLEEKLYKPVNFFSIIEIGYGAATLPGAANLVLHNMWQFSVPFLVTSGGMILDGVAGLMRGKESYLMKYSLKGIRYAEMGVERFISMLRKYKI